MRTIAHHIIHSFLVLIPLNLTLGAAISAAEIAYTERREEKSPFLASLMRVADGQSKPNAQEHKLVNQFELKLSNPTRYGTSVYQYKKADDATTINVRAGAAEISSKPAVGLSVDLTW